MQQQKFFISTIAVLIFSQLVSVVWLTGKINSSKNTSSDARIQNALIEMTAQLKRVEELQYTRVATVNPNTNTVTMDQSNLQSTLRNIVAEELDRISPLLKSEYTTAASATAYAGNAPYVGSGQAYLQSQAIMQEAIQYGEWDEKHTAEMVPLVSSLSPEQRIELTEQYMDAMRRGEIKPTDLAPPL